MAGRLPVVILGAGVCGLYVARCLSARGIPVVVLEKEEQPGGLAAGIERNGNYYDLGIHVLHGFEREILADLQALMGERLKPVELSALIRFGNGFRRYPLEFYDLISGIPPWRLFRALYGLMGQQIKNQFEKSPADDAEEALIRIYGRPIYEYFFRDFTHAYWGFPARELSAGFVRGKMPRLSAVDVIKSGIKKLGFKVEEAAAASALSRETLWYSATGSRELPLALCRAIEENGGQVLLSRPVLQIETKDSRVIAVRYRKNGEVSTLPCAYCLSTTPLPALVESLNPKAPPEVLTAGAHLRYKPIAVFGLLISKPRVLDALYVHFRQRIFHRLAEPKNCGLMVRPEGYTVLIAEMTCEDGDDRWCGGEATRNKLLQDLQAEGLVAPEDIIEMHHFTARYAYPVFYRGYEVHHQTVREYLGQFNNLNSIGRQGGYSYPNMHTAMRQGANAAEKIEQELQKDP